MAYLNLADIQGFILRGYRMSAVQHFVLTFSDAEKSRAFLGRLVDGNPLLPQITTAVDWKERPSDCLNIGLTYPGLAALGLSRSSLASFAASPAFVKGAAARAQLLGDTEESAPDNWVEPLNSSAAHAVLSLHVYNKEEKVWRELLRSKSALLQDECKQAGIKTVSCSLGVALDDGTVHFGFKDGISQPWIDGAPDPKHPNAKNEDNKVPAGAFLLGYPSQWKDFHYPLPQPSILGLNGSFAAFRVLKQDVVAFEDYLNKTACTLDLSPEKLAAKICGRWRNGAPLVGNPDGPLTDIDLADLNSFEYASDPDGQACPFGAHIRRTNPRDDSIAGDVHSQTEEKKDLRKGSFQRRLIRRGMPYGSVYDPKDLKNPRSSENEERGLLGFFICASLEDQYEFIVRQWVNQGGFRKGLPTQAKDPLIGNNSEGDSCFSIPTKDGVQKAKEFSRFVTTKGGLYCFLPSISALKYLSAL